MGSSSSDERWLCYSCRVLELSPVGTREVTVVPAALNQTKPNQTKPNRKYTEINKKEILFHLSPICVMSGVSNWYFNSFANFTVPSCDKNYTEGRIFREINENIVEMLQLNKMARFN